MHIYNTLTREKEQFKPLKDDIVKVYFCGPTPYNFAHIGNLKTYVWNDIIVRSLNFLWYKTKTVMNITDIDDKTIRESQFAWVSLLDFTQKFSDAFFQDIEKLSVEKADIVSPISEVIPEMIRMIQTLLNRGHAYIADDKSIYFKVSSFKKYGKLANLDMNGMKESVRVNNDEYEKDQAADFALWKAWSEADWENSWDWTFTVDWNTITLLWRPGWHIECSACAMKFHGPQIDLHMGGIDNLFPHHQNEVAQTECCTRKTFSKYWAHHGHLTVDGQKMSKSKNNFYTLNNLEKKFSNVPKKLLYRAVRLNFINGKYRDSIDLSFEKIEANFNTLKKIDETLRKLQAYKSELKWVSKDFSKQMQVVIQNFTLALKDDFNIPQALAWFFEFQKYVNSWLADWAFSEAERDAIFDMYKNFNQVLAIIDFETWAVKEIPQEIQDKLSMRDFAKSEKNYELADQMRNEITSAGYKIIDEKQGSRVEKL